ncbi:MAG: hypothetical protein GXP03_07655 [Alphaproteobacteria bacterium]|nr:hypothetical protein [Alphaproteobacteria bacterium]
MTIRSKLVNLAKAIDAQAKKDPEFARVLDDILGSPSSKKAKTSVSRPRNRRAPSVFNPIEFARDGDMELRKKLSELSIEQLKDMVAEHGMDPGKLVMKWKSTEKIVDRIVDISLSRAQKGDAFRRG